MTKMTLGWLVQGAFDETKVGHAYGVNSIGKPYGGIWLSPLTNSGSVWSDFCKEEGMDGFLRNSELLEVEVEKKTLYRFRSEPTKKKIEKILLDETIRGFYIPATYFGWDIPTVWVKELSDLSFVKREVKAS